MPSPSFRTIAGMLALAGLAALTYRDAHAQARAEVFTRNLKDGAELLFSWDSHEKVPFTMDRHGNQLILHFEKPVKLHWGSSLEAVSAYVPAESQSGGDTVVLTLKRPATAHYIYNVGRDESEPDKNGIELLKSNGALQRQEPLQTLDIPAEPENAPALLPHKRAHARQIKKQLVARAKPPAAAPDTETAKLAGLAPAAGTPMPAPQTLPAAPAKAQAVAPAPAPPPVQPAAAAIAPVQQATLPAPSGNVVIPLPFTQDEPFAVFTLRNRLWIVAKHFTPPSPAALAKAGSPLVKDAQAMQSGDATALTLQLGDGISASVEKAPPEGVRLKLSQGPAKLTQTFLPSIATGADGKASLAIPAGTAQDVIALRDPATGDMLSVVPSAETGAGLSPPRSFVQFNLLPSSQGIAVQNLSDGLAIGVHKGVVDIAAEGGLAISPETTEQFKNMESEMALSRLPPTLFPYARWKIDDEKNLVPEQIKLFHDIAFGTPESANRARLKLLDLFLSEGMFPESLGMADDILRSSLKFYRENKVSALRGAAHFFMYHISEAQRDFSAPELAGDREAAMWLALCSELLGNNKAKFDFPANYERYISHYPPSFIQKLGVIAADRSINRKEYDTAGAIFETLKQDNYDEPVKKYIDYMRAKIDSETQSDSEAAKIWEDQSKDLTDPFIRARAEFSLINMMLANDKISHKDAIKRLDKLRIVWRGDSLELGVLMLLGQLYLDEKQYADALHTMRDIVMYYPQVPEAITAARQMESTFVNLYNKDGASAMPPLEAMSLFYEFRDLVPLGAAGDQMIRNLADRLVSIDLLDRAAMLLEHQIRNRLQGEERSKVGAHLAEIYLMNHQPDKALDTLKTTGYGDLPADLQTRRLRLTARALDQQGKTAKAIDVISADNTPEGSALRLTIYWDNKDWANVTSTAEDILGNRNDPGAPLTPKESEVLLKLATAYVYEHDTGQLQYLRDYFTPLMKNNPNRGDFLFITSESGSVDYDNLANLDQDIGAVKTFLSRQDKPGKNGMSRAAN